MNKEKNVAFPQNWIDLFLLGLDLSQHFKLKSLFSSSSKWKSVYSVFGEEEKEKKTGYWIKN